MKTNYTKVCSAKDGKVIRSTDKPISTHERIIIALTELGEDVNEFNLKASFRAHQRKLANPNLNPFN
jgi:hypothetical protein